MKLVVEYDVMLGTPIHDSQKIIQRKLCWMNLDSANYSGAFVRVAVFVVLMRALVQG